jgi:3-mercaptopyruvate sulfurtransferase SseA
VDASHLRAEYVYLLDGGLRAWIEDNFPTDKGPVERAPATFHAKLDENLLRSFAQINQLVADRAQILDARSSGRFTGALPEPRLGLSSGHMFGAISTPYTELLEGSRFKPVLQLREYFTAKASTSNSRSPPHAAPGVLLQIPERVGNRATISDSRSNLHPRVAYRMKCVVAGLPRT